MPKLTAPQWVMLLAFQIFYGLIVFAVTQDMVQRDCAPAVSVQPAAPAVMPGSSITGGAMGSMGLSPEPAGMDQSNPAALAQQGDMYFDNKQYAKAIAAYEQALQLDPTDVDTYNDLGLALHYTGQTLRAVEVLTKGTEASPDYQRIWLTLGFISAAAGDNAGARAAFERCIELGESDIAIEAQRMMGNLP